MADDTVEALVLDFLEWMGPGPRPYLEVLEVWRTSCPRLPVWEEANERGFVTRHSQSGRAACVSVSPAGTDHLRAHRPGSVADLRPVWNVFVRRAGLVDPGLRSVALALSRVPYGRPETLGAQAVVTEWRGTCSTKHILLQTLVHERWPSADIELWHRVYRLTPQWAGARWGSAVAATVPPEGLADVHTFARARLVEEMVDLDVTFPVAAWDGVSPMEIACGPGEDHRAGPDPMATKRRLVAAHCDPVRRERFIEALSALSQPRPGPVVAADFVPKGSRKAGDPAP